jgi:hypothetical protein
MTRLVASSPNPASMVLRIARLRSSISARFSASGVRTAWVDFSSVLGFSAVTDLALVFQVSTDSQDTHRRFHQLPARHGQSTRVQ